MAMIDPYKVLGVSPSSTDEEITQAYRKLAKKYHPDLHPGDKAAEEKMRELNAAYDWVKKDRSGTAQQPYGTPNYGQQSSQYGRNPFEGFDPFFGRQWQQTPPSSTRMQAARNFIASRQYQQALHVLSEEKDHTAEWFFYSALANANVGNQVTALNHAREAVQMNPNNPEYRNLLSQLESGGQTYRQSGQFYGFPMASSAKTLIEICLAQAACFFCCRPC